jgi:hypothetical protein
MYAFVSLQLGACPFVEHLAHLHGIYKTNNKNNFSNGNFVNEIGDHR